MGVWRAGPGERNLGAFVAGAGSHGGGPVKRWDGAARTCHDWDEIRRDPELWFRHGNCLVHLYEKGQSRRGPSFKLPFNDLMESKCFPLIERFFVSSGPNLRTLSDFDTWSRLNPRYTVELYIPPPPAADKSQAFAYHIATRNLFAWVFRRSMVGSHLGAALVGLLHSMHEFRSHLGDNVEDILDYMDEEGYLDIIDQPNHALAVLHLAESFQMRDLYIRAFAHCVGMSEELFATSEYENISLPTRKLMRKARIDMECRLYSASDRLRNFLDDELSAAHIGLAPGARAHLERFRSFLLSYYATRLGYYPPRSFEPSLYRTMGRDFEALYGFLVDRSYSYYTGMPSVAVGGICTLQLIQSFDSLHQYEPLENPLPLLPSFSNTNRNSWVPWRSKLEKSKMKPDQRLMAHTSLIRASNWEETMFQNDLVKAYRTFEEDSVLSPNKADRQEKVSVADARKVRWLVVYAIHQVLRSVTDTPPEVYDAEAAAYPVIVSAENLPPWEEEMQFDHLLRRQTDLALQLSSPSVTWGDSAGMPSGSDRIEIKPDIDYFALTHQHQQQQQQQQPAANHGLELSPTRMAIPNRTNSLTHTLSRNSTIRRSMRLFRPASTPPMQRAPSLSKPMYHEIVVHGYGNGTNAVHVEPGAPQLASPESDSAATSSSLSGSSPASSESGETLDDSIKTPSPTEAPADMDLYFPVEVKPLKPQRRDVVSMLIHPTKQLTYKSLRRPRSTNLTSSASVRDYSSVYEELVEEQKRSFFVDDYQTVGRSSSIIAPKTHSNNKNENNNNKKNSSSSSNNNNNSTKKRHSLQPRYALEDDWVNMQAFLDGGKRTHVVDYEDDDLDVKPAWEQYADLGGLTEMR